MAMHVLDIINLPILGAYHSVILSCENASVIPLYVLLKCTVLLILHVLLIICALQSINILGLLILQSLLPRHGLLLPHDSQIKRSFVHIGAH